MAQIGTIRVQTAGGPVDLPVFDTADIDNDFWRVQTPSGVGAVPMFPASESPALDFLRMQTASGVYAPHDSASMQAIIDDFSDGDIVEYSGDTADWRVYTSTNSPGPEVLESTHSNNAIISVGSTGGSVQNLPSAGDTFRCYIKVTSTTDSSYHGGMVFGIPGGTTSWSNRNGYQVNVSVTSDNLSVTKMKNGANTDLGVNTNVSMTTGTWYIMEVDWGTDGTIVGRLYDTNENLLGSVSGSDTEWTSGGFGWLDNEDGTNAVRFRYGHII